MTFAGELSLWVALLLAIWGTAVSAAGGRLERPELAESGRRALDGILFLSLVAAAGLWHATMTHDFSVRQVASFTAHNMPAEYLAAALWTGPAGGLLLWLTALSFFSVLLTKATSERRAYVCATLALVLAVLTGVLVIAVNPFGRLDWAPLEGRGMNPLLQTPEMLIQPLVLAAAYAASVVPFALSLATLFERRTDDLSLIRQWTAFSLFLGAAALTITMWWAYREAAFHSAWQREALVSGILFPVAASGVVLYGPFSRRLTLALAAVPFPAALLSSFLYPGGIPLVVHGFGGSAAAPALVVAAAIAIASVAWLAANRLGDRAVATDHDTFETGDAGRRIAAAGAMLMLVGVGASLAGRDVVVAAPEGQRRQVVDPFGSSWTFINQGMSRYDGHNWRSYAFALDVAGKNRPGAVFSVERRDYMDAGGAITAEPVTESAIIGEWKQDAHVTLGAVRADRLIELRVSFAPLVRLVWLGGGLLAAGALATALNRRA